MLHIHPVHYIDPHLVSFQPGEKRLPIPPRAGLQRLGFQAGRQIRPLQEHGRKDDGETEGKERRIFHGEGVKGGRFHE